jgi:hypothetical protein
MIDNDGHYHFNRPKPYSTNLGPRRVEGRMCLVPHTTTCPKQNFRHFECLCHARIFGVQAHVARIG